MKNFNFKKKFGQNFLIDENIVNKIISIANDKEDSLVIEIGCGDGRLTKKLCENFSFVLGYEIDNEVRDNLLNNIKDLENNNIIFDDFLSRNLKEDIKKYNYKNIYVISNLPYYITTPIIQKLIDEQININKMILMVQKEVGDRFSAKYNTKEYSSITVYLNYYFDIKKEFIVSKNCFYPKPNVDSIIVSFTSKNNKILLNDEKLFFKLVRDAFKYKRKTIKNNLKDYDLIKIEEILNKNGLNLNTRAEQIPIEIFCEISNYLSI